MDFDILIPAFIGLFLGVGFSVMLGVYNKNTASTVTKGLFGITSSALLNDIIIFLMAFFVVVASTFSILIRDLTFPQAYPLNFTLETLFVAFVPALMIFAMTILRNKPVSAGVFLEYGLLAVKFGLAHILFQFSGVYTNVFGL